MWMILPLILGSHAMGQTPVPDLWPELSRSGVPLADVDGGTLSVEWAAAKVSSAQVRTGAGDGIVAQQEWIEYVLVNERRHPTLARQIPGHGEWDLPPTRAARVASEVSFLREELSRSASGETGQSLATALFWFVWWPSETSPAGWSDAVRRHASTAVQQLEALGLGRYAKRLSQSGGLGTSTFHGEAPVEMTVQQALDTHVGGCTERSKVLFAVLDSAGLSPRFAWTSGEEMWRESMRQGLDLSRSPAGLRAQPHSMVVVGTGLQSRVLDVTNSIPDWHGAFQELSRTQFLALMIGQRAAESPDALPSAEVFALFQHASALDPENWWIRLAFVTTLANQGDLKGARSEWNRLPQAARLSHEARVTLGYLLQREGALAESETVLRGAVSLYVFDPNAWFRLGITLMLRDNHSDALAAFQRSVELQPSAQRWYRVGLELQTLSRFSEAANAYRAALSLDQGRSDAWNNLGNCLHALGDLQGELDAHLRAVSADALNTTAQLNVAEDYVSLGMLERALPYYRAAISANPRLRGAYKGLGRALMTLGRCDEAFSLATAWAAAMPEDPDAVASPGRVRAKCAE